MEVSRAADALAKASAALVDSTDTAGSLATLLAGCNDVLRIDASGILVEDGEQLDVLAASSHTAAELELHQTQLDEGPCVDAHASGQAVNARAEELSARWPRFGATMLEAGYGAVHASPLRWHGEALGAMGVFRRSDVALDDDEQVVAQAFADLATLMIVQSTEVDLTVIQRRLQQALATRVVIEQAKGVLAETRGVDMAEAYALLLRLADSSASTLSSTARAVLDQARRQVT
jgi:transcriptional regulator with GAF, ATPase, and Fis domain